MVLDTDSATYEEVLREWREEIDAESSPTDKGRAFALKICSQWLDVPPDDDNFHWIDGAGDGGIDIAYFDQGRDADDPVQDADQPVGDTWYVLQCKYGSAAHGSNTVLHEGQKFLQTITESRRVSDPAKPVVEKLRTFVSDSGGDLDRLIYVVATLEPLDSRQADQLIDLRRVGQSKMVAGGPRFDTVAVSVKDLHDAPEFPPFELKGSFSDMSGASWVGSVILHDLYAFLDNYRSITRDLDRIYEKNVRRWLGFRKTNRVNYGLKQTVEEAPEKLGIYNNGITLVVERFEQIGTDRWSLTMPYIVNGCQTTRTIFEVVDSKLGSGGNRKGTDVDKFKDRILKSALVVKIVETADDEALRKITLYSNTQNAVRASDLVALDDDYIRWKREVEEQHTRFLEIQRGGWDSRKAYERRMPDIEPRFTKEKAAEPINANDMIKVFASGWLGYAGTAAKRSADFLPPGGFAFKEVVKLPPEDFGADTFIAADLLYRRGKALHFGGRSSNTPTRRRYTRFAFYYAFVQLAKSILQEPGTPVRPKDVTRLILVLARHPDGLFDSLTETAASLLDQYFSEESAMAFVLDPGWIETQSLEAFVQSNRLDERNIPAKAPRFRQSIDVQVASLGQSFGTQPSFRDQYRVALGL